MNRRDLLRGAVLTGAALAAPAAWSRAADGPGKTGDMAALEQRAGGRLGVAVLDTQTGRRLAHRAQESFPICSTFKLLLVAAILSRVAAGEEQLDRRVVFQQDDLLDWAPVTRLNVGPPGMPIEDLCRAAVMISDNTAANLLLDALKGPAALTSWMRGLGDAKTRLSHYEPVSSDEDVTTPHAMLADMNRILLGDVLPANLREKLMNWLRLNLTGSQTLAAGLPPDWRMGDKTGADHRASNDVALIQPPGHGAVLVAAYYVNESGDASSRKAVLAEVGRNVALWLQAGTAPS